MTSKNQKNREKILKGTQELIMSQGLTNTSTSQLVKHIRISKTTLYKYFSTKEELINEAVLSILNEIENELNAIIKKENVLLLDKIQQFIYVIVGHVKELRVDVINDIKQKRSRDLLGCN
ncbi:TetR/AcrR family transcriptional regulator [Priestia megaterium]|uniref:TetR/AcrR family transcriptional regulator n=1 Tax=Priestia megaterium TaxID=1404 RepID=UPI001AE0E1C0|nr:TetR/AcrR family transcriptional regulator [Priestia megaterium]